MRICNLSDGLGQLARAVTDLNERWAETKQSWRDDASREFEETHLGPIPAQMQTLTAAVQALAAVVEKAHRDLDDPREG